MSMLRRFAGWPLGVGVLLGPAVLVVAATMFTSYEQWGYPYQDWVYTSLQFHEQLLLAGPIAAAAATYYGGRLVRAGRLFAQPCAVRAGGPVVVRHLVTLCGTFLVAYLIGLAPLVVLTIMYAQAGGPVFAGVVTGLLGMIMLTTLGYGIGAITGSAWLTPLTLVLAFVGVQSTAYAYDKFAAVDPVTNFAFTLGRVPAWPITGYRIAFFVFVTIAIAVVAARAARHQRRLHLPSAVSMGLFVLLVTAVVVPAITQPAIATEEIDPPQVCTDREGIEYCVHSGHRDELDTMVDTAATLFRFAGGPPDGVTKVRDTSLNASRDDASASDTIWVHLAPLNPTRKVTSQYVVLTLSGIQACWDKYPGAQITPEPMRIQHDLAAALSIKEGSAAWGAEFETDFTSLSIEELADWFSQHRTVIENCELTEQDLP